MPLFAALLRSMAHNMTYIKRDEFGLITAVSQEPLEGFSEMSQDDEAAVTDFVEANLEFAEASFIQHDLDFVRVIEDVIELLMAKNVIQFTELPEASQGKMLNRQKLRSKLQNHLDLLGDDSLF